MKAGYFRASKEILSDPQFSQILKSEISKVFKEVCRKEVGNGIVEIHGESELFDLMPEGATQQYDCHFKTIDGVVKFDRFRKV